MDPARGLVALVVGVNACALQLGGGGDHTLVQARHSHQRLEGRTGGVRARQSAVEQGEIGVGGEGGVVPVVGHKIVGRIGCQRQKLTRIGIHRHHGARATILISIRVLDEADVLQQSPLGGDLQVDIDGQVNVLPRDGLDLHVLVHDHAVLVLDDHLDAVLTPQVGLKGRLAARFAHDGVHVIAQRLVFLPLLGIDGARLTQNVGGVTGIGIHAGGGGGITNTRKTHFQLTGDRVHGNAVCHHVIVDAGEARGLHAPQNAQKAVDLGVGI